MLTHLDRSSTKVGQTVLFYNTMHVYRVVVEEVPKKRFGTWKTKRITDGQEVQGRGDDFFAFEDEDTDMIVKMEQDEIDAKAKVDKAHAAFLEAKKVHDAADEVWVEAEEELDIVTSATFDKLVSSAKKARAV